MQHKYLTTVSTLPFHYSAELNHINLILMGIYAKIYYEYIKST